MTAFALILSLVENLLPPVLVFAPGTKLGLANAVILAAIVLFGFTDAAFVLLAKCLLAALFSGNPFSLVYAVPAGIISFTVQYLLYRFLFPRIGLPGISLTGAIAHNMTQLLTASLVTQANLFYLMPFTLLASVLAGLFVGFTVYFTVRYMPKKIFVKQN